MIAPLLVLWLRYEQWAATGTSLATIIAIGALAAVQLMFAWQLAKKAGLR